MIRSLTLGKRGRYRDQDFTECDTRQSAKRSVKSRIPVMIGRRRLEEVEDDLSMSRQIGVVIEKQVGLQPYGGEEDECITVERCGGECTIEQVEANSGGSALLLLPSRENWCVAFVILVVAITNFEF